MGPRRTSAIERQGGELVETIPEPVQEPSPDPVESPQANGAPETGIRRGDGTQAVSTTRGLGA